MIIDCHCHAGKGDGLTGPWNTDAPLGRYLARAKAAGIGGVNFLPAFHTNYGQANRGLAQLIARAKPGLTPALGRVDPRRFADSAISSLSLLESHPVALRRDASTSRNLLRDPGQHRRALGLKMFAFAFVHAKRDAGRVLHLVRTAVQQYGFIGIKCHRHDARLTREICEAGRALGVPILYDVTGEIAPIELYAREYRDVAFIIPHLGSFVDDWAAQLQLIDHLTRHPNVFTDTAGVRRFDLLVEAVRRAGPGKVLFGSDGPYLHPGVELAKIRALGLKPEHERAILGGNFLKLTRAARVRQERIAA